MILRIAPGGGLLRIGGDDGAIGLDEPSTDGAGANVDADVVRTLGHRGGKFSRDIVRRDAVGRTDLVWCRPNDLPARLRLSSIPNVIGSPPWALVWGSLGHVWGN